MSYQRSFGFHLLGSLPAFLSGYILVMLSIFSIGMMVGNISQLSDSERDCKSALFPNAYFSGATLPYEIMPSALQKIADILPLTQE